MRTRKRQPCKIFNLSYNTLRSIKKPEADRRAEAIFYYFGYDNTIDDNEWAAGCEALGRVRWVGRYLGTLIPGDTLSPILEKRITDLVSRCSRGEIGSPAVDVDNIVLNICVHMGFLSHNIPEKYADYLKDLWYPDRYSPLGDTLFTLAADMASHIKENKD